MKKIFAVFVLLVLVVFTTVAIAGQAGIINRQSAGQSGLVQLYSQATGTTAATNTNYAVFDYVMNNVSCDIMVSPSTAGTVTFLVTSSVNSTSAFDFTPNIATTSTITTGGIRTISKTGVPFRVLQATVTAPTTTAVITVNCGGVQ